MIIKNSFSKVFRQVALNPVIAIKIAIAITFFLAVSAGWNSLISYYSLDEILQDFQIQFQVNQNAKLAIQNQIQLRLESHQQDSLGRVLVSLFRLFFLMPLWILILQIVKRNLRNLKTIQKTLQISKERTNATLLALPDLIFRVNRDGEYLEFLSSPLNRTLEDNNRRVGTSIYTEMQVDILPDHTKSKHSAIEKALSTQTLQSYEQRVWVGDILRYEEVRVAPCGNDEVVFFIRDISNLKQAEKVLKESEEFKKRILESVTDCIKIIDLDGKITYMNEAGQCLMEIDDFSLCFNTDWVSQWPNETHPAIKAAITDAKAGQKGKFCGFCPTAKGTPKWWDVVVVPMLDQAGEVTDLLSVSRDVTDRKQGELRLQQQSEQERLQAAITQRMRSSLNIGEILDSTVEEVHQVLKSDRVLVFKIAPDFTGSIIAEAVLPHCQKSLNIVFPRGVISQEIYNYYLQSNISVICDCDQQEHTILTPSVIEFLIELQVQALVAVPIIHDQLLWGLLVGNQCDSPRQWQDWEIDLLNQTAAQLAIGIHQANLYEQIQSELSIRKQTELQLLRVNDELLSATKLKDEFLANMSHELRTPLNSILGLSEALHDQVLGMLNEKQLKAIGTVASSGEHLLSLINDILDLSKISTGMMKLDTESVSVQNLCDSSLSFVKQQAFNKRIQVFSNIPPHINKIDVELRRMKQVLINLLTNAVKFTPNEGQISLLVADGSGDKWQGEATIPQRLKDINSPMIVFQVVDTGIGIAANDLPQLFQPFVQVDSALNRQYEGTGLGLTLVKQIVELHGGQVIVESEVGKGSRFTVALPYEMSESSAPESEPTATTSQPLVVNPENEIAPLILLAEDNDANIQTFTSYLTAINYRVIVAKNGEEVVSMAKVNSPDIILMDVQMPFIDGLEATKQIRLAPNLINTPIIAITALAMEGDRERCLAAGMNGYMSKPLKLKQLATQIDELLQITKR